MSRTKMYSSVTAKEISSFVTTCNRLGLFLKEKGSRKDLGLDENFDAREKRETVDLLSNMEINSGSKVESPLVESPVQTSTESEKTANPLPQYVSLDSLCKSEGIANISGYNETGTKTAPMTIFYGGQVLVFDNISDYKARDLLLLASGGSIPSNQIQNQASTSTSNSTCEVYGSPEHIIPRLNGPDLPIARRASLHKFLARRKERVTARPTPYQSHNTLKTALPSTHKFDLNF